MPIKMLSENHRSAELQAELVFPVSAVSIGSALLHHPTSFLPKGEACKNARGMPDISRRDLWGSYVLW